MTCGPTCGLAPAPFGDMVHALDVIAASLARLELQVRAAFRVADAAAEVRRRLTKVNRSQ